MMSFDHLLNRPAEEVAYSHPAGSIPSPSSPGHPSASSPTARAHKYSNSGASTASFASSSGTHPFGSHSRTSSYSTNPETPPAENFPPDNFRIASNDGSDKMADMVEPIDVVGKFDGGDARASRRAYPFAGNRAIDLTEEDDRAESPTDAVMPMMRRAPAESVSTSSPLTYSRAPAALEAMANPAPTEDHKVSGSDSEQSVAQSVAVSAPASGQSGAMVPANAPALFPASAGYNPGGAQQLLRISQPLIAMVVPHLFPTVDRLMGEIDFLSDRVCKYMEGVCHMTADVDKDKINWRKAMSHVFGRNKNCTRSIPDRVWLWFCRKHYQRGRYRNGHDYAKKQVWAVTVQVLRLEAWSNYNQDMGVPQDGVVVDWTLDIRRREQLRLEDAGRKHKMSHDMDDDDDEGDDGPESPRTPDSGLVPQWLLNERGANKSTADMLRILDRIRRELNAGILTNFPDIEILPNITGERAKPKTNRAKPRNPPVRRALPQRPKRQRVDEEEEEDEAASYMAPPRGSRTGRFADHQRVDYGNPSTPARRPWGTIPQDGDRAHMRARSMDVGAHMALQGGASAGYPPPPDAYPGYHQQAGYGQSAVQNRDYMRPDNAYQNGYWDPGYDARQRAQQQAQQQQAVYPYGGYYQSSTGTGAPQGGPPPISAAKHSRNLSTPVRSTSMMMGGRPQEPYGTAPMARPQDAYSTQQMTRPQDQYSAQQTARSQDGYSTPQMAPREGLARASHDSTGNYPPPGNRYQMFSGLPMPTATAPSDNIPRAADYRGTEYATPVPSRHAGHGAAPPADGYEPYPSPLRRQ